MASSLAMRYTGTFIFSFMEEEPCGKNALSVLREWKKQ